MATGRTQEVIMTLMAARASRAATVMYRGISSWSISCTSLMRAEKPATKHFSLATCRMVWMACMVSREAAGESKKMSIWVELPLSA